MGCKNRKALARALSRAWLKRSFIFLILATIGAQSPVDADTLQLSLPGSEIEKAIQPGQPNVFGTIALPVRPRPISTRWTKIMNASLDQPRLIRFTAQARELPPEEKVTFIQVAVSHAMRTSPETTDCSDDGYWAPAEETLSRGSGDCFDIAVAKMEALRLLGIPGSDLFLTTGYSDRGPATGRGHETVALLVRIGTRFWLLPEQSERAIEAGNLSEDPGGFFPVLTYGVGETWVHGRLATIAAHTP